MKKIFGLIFSGLFILGSLAYAGKLVINANTSDPAPKRVF